jgi:DNA-binding transcriptional LysR family regulator
MSTPTPPQLDDLDVFARVVEHKSISAAARKLGVPKSTVSRSVARLEDSLGVRLLQRTTRALAPTDAGQTLYDEVLPHVEALRGAAACVTSAEGTPRGVLRVTAPNDLATLLLADVITRFTQRYPEITVELVPTPRTLDLIAENIDVAVRAGLLRDSTLVARKLRETELQLFASPSYLARRGTPRTIEELEGHDCVLFRANHGRARWALESKTGKVSVEVTGRLSSDDFTFLLAATVAGAGIGLVPRFTAEVEVRGGRLVRVLPGHASAGGAVYIVHASSKHVPRKVAAFRDFIIETFASLPPL